MQCIKSIISNIRQFQTSPIIYRRAIAVTKWKTPIRLFITQVDDESEIVDQLCHGNLDLEKTLKILMLEVEVMRQDGRQAPSKLQKNHWEHLLTLSSRNQRSNYLRYLWKTEKAKENEKAKKEERRKEFALRTEEVVQEYPDDLLYGIKHQSLFLRIRDQSINQFDNYRALQAMRWGAPVIIDCSYEQNMVWREALNAAKQMTLVFGSNRIHKDPFNIHMCNVDLEGEFMKQLRKNIPSLDEPWFPLNIHTRSYLDIFPKQKLVYLTPHCREELTNYDHDAIYIIGCMVDKINNEPLSLAKAKRDGLKMARLPLDRYLEWAPGATKNININHMVPILLDLKMSGDWDFALQHIPRRKLMETKITAMQYKIRNSALAKEEIFKNFKMGKSTNKMSFREKRFKSKQSLYDDDNI